MTERENFEQKTWWEMEQANHRNPERTEVGTAGAEVEAVVRTVVAGEAVDRTVVVAVVADRTEVAGMAVMVAAGTVVMKVVTAVGNEITEIPWLRQPNELLQRLSCCQSRNQYIYD